MFNLKRDNIVLNDIVLPSLNVCLNGQNFVKVQENSNQCIGDGQQLSEEAVTKLGDWDKLQLQVLIQNYLKYGSSWLLIREALPGRTQNNIKNKFYQGIKSGSNSLRLEEKRLMKGSKIRITVEHIKSFLEFVNNLQRQVSNQGLTIRENSKIFSLRRSILDFCFLRSNFQDNRIQHLINQIKQMTFQFKNYKFFKSSTRRNWTINQSALRNVYYFDKFIKQEIKFDFEVVCSTSIEDEEKKDLTLEQSEVSLDIGDVYKYEMGLKQSSIGFFLQSQPGLQF